MKTTRLLAPPIAPCLALGLVGPAGPAPPPPPHRRMWRVCLPDGSTYVMDVPANWNGTVLLYSHGYVPDGAPNPA